MTRDEEEKYRFNLFLKNFENLTTPGLMKWFWELNGLAIKLYPNVLNNLLAKAFEPSCNTGKESLMAAEFAILAFEILGEK